MVLPLHISRPIVAMVLGVAAVAVLAFDVRAGSVCVFEPAKLRFEDNTSCSDDAADRGSFPALLKDIPLTASGDVSASIGGEMRQRYEYTENPGFGADPQDSRGVWLQRLTLHGDLRLGEHVRLFGQAFHALEAGRAGGPSPVDENRFEFQNAFFELSAGAGEASLMTRLGRQEIELGSGRLISVREGPNNRRNFDGARVEARLPGWRIDGFLARPVVPASGVLDDQTSDEQWIWALYATLGDLVPLGDLDLYYIGFRDDGASYVEGAGEEERHSIGARYFGGAGVWDWNVEGLYQFGKFRSGDIRAWTIATDLGVTLDLLWRPRLGLSMNVASGDDNASDGDLGTFNPLFPRGNYFSEAAVLGPRNFFNVHPSLEIEPTSGWSAAAGANFFWRLETADGVYTPSGQILRAPSGSKERFVGTGLSLSTSYDLATNLTATAIYTRLFPGAFLRDTGPAEDIHFFEATLQYRF